MLAIVFGIIGGVAVVTVLVFIVHQKARRTKEGNVVAFTHLHTDCEKNWIEIHIIFHWTLSMAWVKLGTIDIVQETDNCENKVSWGRNLAKIRSHKQVIYIWHFVISVVYHFTSSKHFFATLSCYWTQQTLHKKVNWLESVRIRP